MNISEIPQEYKLSDAIVLHDTLNPLLWNSKGVLHSDVHSALLAIATDFREFMGVNDISLVDIRISGSNAAYSYTKHSDIDLHLIVDLSQIALSPVFIELFDAKKYQYNDQHNIFVKGYSVEVYVQQIDQHHVSLGEYSLLNNEWIKYPSMVATHVNDSATKQKYDHLKHVVNAGIKSDELDTLNSLTNVLTRYRKAGLDKHGELGPENLAYKMLRNQGLVDKLYAHWTILQDRTLSLESKRKKKTKPSGMFPGYTYHTPETELSEVLTKITNEWQLVSESTNRFS
jgi:hypothetical protein